MVAGRCQHRFEPRRRCPGALARGPGQRIRTPTLKRRHEMLSSRATVSTDALSGGSNLATALSLNACPYLADVLK